MSGRASPLVSLLLAGTWFAACAVGQVPGSGQPEGGSTPPRGSDVTVPGASDVTVPGASDVTVPDAGEVIEPGAASGASAAPLAGEPSKQRTAPNATVEQPRAFGYVVGDLLTQRVLLNLNGREFVPAELPLPGRVGVWFERRSVHVDEDASGRRWLTIDYQLMNSPQALRVVTLPAWKMKPADSGRGELRIAEWPITVGPLTPERPEARSGLGALQPDRIAPSVALAPIERGLGVGIAGFILTGLAWLAWLFWRNLRASAAQPFARAMSEMRGVDGTAPEAWHALHRAFDATAGRAVRPETLPELFRRAPHLLPLRAQIEEFFRQSAARFFAGAPAGTDLSAQVLCRELRRIEKRHER